MTRIAPSAHSVLSHPDRFYIDGEWVRGSSDALIDVIDSNTESLFYQVAEARAADIARAVEAARAAFDRGPWPRMTHAQRGEYVRAMAEELRGRSETLSEIWPRESGQLIKLARTGAATAAGTLDFYGRLADTYAWEEVVTPSSGTGFGLVVHEPVGTVAAIVPWNSPIMSALRKIAPALVAGCTTVLKAAPEAPGAPYLIAEVADAVGLPRGVLNVVTADREASEELVRDPRIDKVSFTGSTAVGRRIGMIMADRVGRCTLELGGKSAAVILDDADLAAAAESIATTECRLAGQVCSALTRIVVTRSRHDEFVEALGAAFAAKRVGDAFDESTQVGPLASAKQLRRVEHYVEVGRSEGARLVTGGGRPSGLDRGYFVEPTVFGGVHNSSTIASEEIFGPVLSVIPARDEDDAVRIANDSRYGLNASVFTTDVDRARGVAGRLRTGTVGHNADRIDFGIGFGGFKQSGIGREGGLLGILPYLEAKTVLLDGPPAEYR